MSMDQNITLNIAGNQFQLKASTPEMERLMRIAAEDINKMLDRYTERYPDKKLEEKLLFVTLTQAVSRLTAQSKLNAAMADAESLANKLADYLKDIDSNR